MVDAAAVDQAVALIIHARHSSEIEFPYGLSEREIESLKIKVNKENRHINNRLTIVGGIRLPNGPGTLFILGGKKKGGRA